MLIPLTKGGHLNSKSLSSLTSHLTLVLFFHWRGKLCIRHAHYLYCRVVWNSYPLNLPLPIKIRYCSKSHMQINSGKPGSKQVFSQFLNLLLLSLSFMTLQIHSSSQQPDGLTFIMILFAVSGLSSSFIFSLTPSCLFCTDLCVIVFSTSICILFTHSSRPGMSLLVQLPFSDCHHIPSHFLIVQLPPLSCSFLRNFVQSCPVIYKISIMLAVFSYQLLHLEALAST